MTPREKELFNKNIQAHLKQIEEDSHYEHLSGEDALDMAVERAEADFDSYQDMKMEDQREKEWE